MRFTKMHGLGNDYLYVFAEAPDNAPELSVRLSDRHFGAGSDGMIFISRSSTADFKMRIFNADGSEAKMCGNGIRCAGKYVYDKGYTDRTILKIETLSGIRTLELHIISGKVSAATVDIGQAAVNKEMTLQAGGQAVTGTPVSTGNPHFVIFVPDMEQVPVSSLGPVIEKHESFPGGVNVEFVQVTGKDQLRMRVWERGSGITMACGTGASASAAAAVHQGLCDPEVPISVILDGGVLKITVENSGTVKMTGPAVSVYEGETNV